MGDGGIGDYLKFFMILVRHGIQNDIQVYCLQNNILIQKFIKFKHKIMIISHEEISKLNDFEIHTPYQHYHEADNIDFPFSANDLFEFSDEIKQNSKLILPSMPNDYTSIHLRLGDKFLETDKNFVICKNDTRDFDEQKLYEFIRNNSDKVMTIIPTDLKLKTHLKI